MKFKQYIILAILILHKIAAIGQYPQYLIYNDENGMPSNEIYSIVQDKKGFVWFGCDAGLYKYDGIRYIAYKCQKQRAKSISGLTISSSGILYCYNFQSQVFMLKNDTMTEIRNLFPSKITSISSQKNGQLLISHSGGFSVYTEQKNRWIQYGTTDNELAIKNNNYVTKSSKHNSNDSIFFLKTNGISLFAKGKLQKLETKIFKNQSPGSFILEYHNRKLWIFSAEKNIIYTYSDSRIEQLPNSNLLRMLLNRKITSVSSLPDGKLWICTYKGIIKYDASTEKAELFYPEKSFSDCIIDREGNYWFSTLQTGLLRVPNLELLVWNTDNKLLNNDKISKICFGDQYIYFATINGTIGKLHSKKHELQTFHTGNYGDVQSFEYDEPTKTLWFYINNNLLSLKGNKIEHKESDLTAIKIVKQIGSDCFIGSSQGLYVNNKKIKLRWIREIEYDENAHVVWVACNDGLLKVIHKNKEWLVEKVLFEGEQILSIDFDEDHKIIYALTFNGLIYTVNQKEKINFIAQISDKTQAVKIQYKKEVIYAATNRGLWKYNIKKNTWEILTTLSGLASNNVQSLVIPDHSIWLATSKGVQKIPFIKMQGRKKAIVYLKKIVAGKTNSKKTSNLLLKYGESILLYPEASTYNSGNDYQYAYRIKSNDANWINLPSSIDKIEIQNIPSGDFEIELKVIDHLGIDSENTILLHGIIKLPYWKSLWFIIIIIILISVFFYLFFSIRIYKLRQSQLKQIERINLENDLRLSRETALKSQMNPHFIFNVLNSIKAYIYKNDKQKASEYLNEFSALIRTFLNMSNSATISLSEELKMIKLYTNMEAMLLKDDFIFEQNIDEHIDLANTHIPSLILQPFIENAFKHGLHHKKGSKQLVLNIALKNKNKIVIEIIDNGIGRAAAQEINKAETITHQSFATTAIEKRVELINKDRKLVAVEIVDLINKEISLGTKVIIKIKLDE